MATATLTRPDNSDLQLCDIRPVAKSRCDRTPRSWQTIAVQIAIAVGAGILHGGSWLWPGEWYFAWIAQVVAIGLAVSCKPRLAFAYGLITGSVGIGCSFYWGIESLRQIVDAGPVIAVLAFALLVLVEGTSFALFSTMAAMIAGRGIGFFWLIPCAWTVVEHWYPRLFPWKLGYSQLEWIALLQIAELIGSVGIGFVVTAVAAIPAAILVAWRSKLRSDLWAAAAYSACAALLLAATLIFGSVRQWQWSTWAAQQPKLKIGLIQIDPAFVGSEDKLRERSLAIHDQVDLICWPESALGIYSESLTHFRDTDRTLVLSRNSQQSLEPAKGFASTLLAGAKLYRGEEIAQDGPFSQAGLLIGPEQDILGRYRKRTLLPLGEYVPFQSRYPALRRWFTIQDIYEAGQDPAPLCMSCGHRLGVLICYEDMIPGNARQTTAAGAEALFSLIQGTAFENPLTLVQHQRLAALRAVENRRYFVRCASTGLSCIIDPVGRVIAKLPMQTEGTLIGEIALLKRRTLYSRCGDLFSLLCTVILAGAGFGLRRTKNLLHAPRR